MLDNARTRKPVKGLHWLIRLVLRLTWEIALGLAIVWVARLEQQHNPPPTLGVPWTLFWTFTVLIFAPPLGRYRNHWRRVSFWAVVVALLAIHIVWWTNYIRSWFAGSTGGSGSSHFPMVLWVLWGLPEYGAIRALFYWRFNPDRQTMSLGVFLDQGKSTTKHG